jgi:hypothetical protein
MEVKQLLKTNKEKLKKLEGIFNKKPSLTLAKKIVELLMSGVFGVYYNEIIESFYRKRALKNKVLIDNYKSITPIEKSILHVATKVYKTGGHTRVIERWLDVSDASEKHSVILLKQTNLKRVPVKLKKLVAKKNGELKILQSSKSINSKANELRNLALNYGTIVLHHHPDDPVPLMAFSAKEFKRPVICFNHSGHTFWLGNSIVDFCIDIEKNQNICTISKRGIENTSIIDMPTDEYLSKKVKKSTIFNLSKELNIPKDSLLLVSMASMYKYTPIAGFNFINAIREILNKNETTAFIGIGITNTTDDWKNLVAEFKNRVFLLGHVNYDKISNYLSNAHLYLDSFPYNSWVSLLDAIRIGKCACLVLETPVGYPNFIDNTFTLCTTVDELISKSSILLKSKEKREEVFKELNTQFLEKCSKNFFKNQIETIISQVNLLEKNTIKRVSLSEKITKFDEFNYIFRNTLSTKITGKKNIFQIKKEKQALLRKIEVIIFGISVTIFKKDLLKSIIEKTKK